MNRDPSRLRPLVAAFLLVPLGFALKYGVTGRAGPWAGCYGAALVYEMFWVLLAGAAWQRVAPWRLAALVFVLTCALEFLQLWQPPFLTAVRATWWGAPLVGTVFDPMDFPHYALGVAAGSLLLGRLRR